MARFSKSPRSIVFTMYSLLVICTLVNAGGKKVDCKPKLNDYPTPSKGPFDILTLATNFVSNVGTIVLKSENQGTAVDSKTFDHPVDMIQDAGFGVECHKVTSNDRYTTQLFRILPPKNSDKKQKHPILIGHGLLSSAVDWLLVESEHVTPYNLAREGYEVWLWNSRGNQYSVEYESRDTSQSDYWDFGVHEMAVNDTSAIIDYMLRVTKAEKINYIGYSLTTTIFHILMSERPGYNEKINKMVSLAPAVYLTRTTSPLKALSKVSNSLLLEELQKVNNGRAYPKELEPLLHKLVPGLCDLAVGLFGKHANVLPAICQSVMYLLAGRDEKAFNKKTLVRQAAHMPTDTSARAVLLYLQYFKNAVFNQYDFGPEENERRYKGSRTPPKYYLSNTTVDMMVSWGGQDELVNADDVKYYMKELKSSANVTECYSKPYSHLSFVYADCQRDIVFKPILNFFQGKKPECKSK